LHAELLKGVYASTTTRRGRRCLRCV